MFKFTSALFAVLLATGTLPARADFLSGSTNPSNELGSNGDHYLQTTSGMLYKKSADTWSQIQSRLLVNGERGHTGARGAAGPAGPAGPRVRTVGNASLRASAHPIAIGEVIIQLDNNSLWRGNSTSAGDWTQIVTAPAGLTITKISLLSGDAEDTDTTPHLIFVENPLASGTDRLITFPDTEHDTIGPGHANFYWVEPTYHYRISRDLAPL